MNGIALTPRQVCQSLNGYVRDPSERAMNRARRKRLPRPPHSVPQPIVSARWTTNSQELFTRPSDDSDVTAIGRRCRRYGRNAKLLFSTVLRVEGRSAGLYLHPKHRRSRRKSSVVSSD